MIQTLIWLINLTVQLVTLLIILQVFLSYLLSPYHSLRQAIDRIVIPILMKIRRYVPPIGGLDLSPLVLLILVQLTGRILISILTSFSRLTRKCKMAPRNFHLHDGKKGAALAIRVTPRASRNEIVEILSDGTVRIRLTAPPAEDKANQALVKYPGGYPCHCFVAHRNCGGSNWSG